MKIKNLPVEIDKYFLITIKYLSKIKEFIFRLERKKLIGCEYG